MAVEYAKSFSSDVLAWKDAKRWHPSLAESLAKGSVLNDSQMNHVWNALVGIQSTAPVLLCDAVNWTMPVEYRRFMLLADCMPAAYALHCIEAELYNVPLDNAYALRTAMKRAWERFRARKQQASNIESGFGCDQSAAWHTLVDIDRAKMGHDFKRQIDNIARLAGRMFDALAPSKIKTPNEDPEEVCGARHGADIPRLLPSELAKMVIPETEDYIAMKLLKKTADQFKMKGTASTTRGALVLVLDESLSMRDVYGRVRTTWCKSVAIALARIAWSEGRDVHCVHFGGSVAKQIMTRNDARSLFEMAASFVGGGTQTQPALDRAIELVGDLEKQGLKGADIALITDGVDHRVAEIEASCLQMVKLGIRLWTVGIGVDIGEDHPVRKFAEKYVFARDSSLHDPGMATALVAPLSEAAMDPNKDPHLN